jgi:hypothetical protein
MITGPWKDPTRDDLRNQSLVIYVLGCRDHETGEWVKWSEPRIGLAATAADYAFTDRYDPFEVRFWEIPPMPAAP